ncbi:hypothetical protein ACH47Z_40485 [Streptomyces sp. NPDC020192]|uniref:hypothetical protein n=1 Tax=Streptomyces sp. NPDC020192 TaxID=3365066 RepID=UPI0037B660B5
MIPSGDGGFIVTMAVHPDRAGQGTKVPDHTVAGEDHLRDQVQKILDNAAKSDSTATDVLMALVDESKYGFSGAVYKDRDQAEKAVQEADELAKLARKDPAKLTPADFDKINAGLKQYHNDPLFSEEFAELLGAQGTEKFWLGLNDDREGGHLAYDRGYKYAELQKNLGLTLATASQSDSAGMTAWKQQVIATGNRAVGTHGDVLGFQVMSNLMRNGDFDDTFMNDYGCALMKTERFYTDDGKNVAWQANICPPAQLRGQRRRLGSPQRISGGPGEQPDSRHELLQRGFHPAGRGPQEGRLQLRLPLQAAPVADGHPRHPRCPQHRRPELPGPGPGGGDHGPPGG